MMKTCACFAVAALVLSGCNQFAMTVSDPKWEPAVLAKTGCPDLDGTYYDDGQSGLFQQLQLFMDADGSNVIYPESLQAPSAGPITFFSVKQRPDRGYTLIGGQQYESVIPEKVETFRPKIRTVIEGNNVYFSDDAGTIYTKAAINMNHPYVGCNNGKLVFRSLQVALKAGQKSEGLRKNFAIAYEAEFAKLPDGNIQAAFDSRWWISTMNSIPDEKHLIRIHQAAPKVNLKRETPETR